jgi:hypothetical protein
MTEDEFWSIVHSAGGGQEGDCEAQSEIVRQRLAGLPSEEIASFKERFQEQMNRAYSWDLWGAAFIIIPMNSSVCAEPRAPKPRGSALNLLVLCHSISRVNMHFMLATI